MRGDFDMMAKEVRSVKHSKFGVVTEIREKTNDKLNPVIVTFQNGEILPEEARNCTVTLTPGQSGRTQVEVQSQEGQVFQEVDLKYPKTKQYIAIRHKKTKEIRIIEVDSVTLTNSIFVRKVTAATTDECVNNSDKHGSLKKLFGSKKGIAKSKQSSKLSINSSLIEDEIREAAEVIKQETNEASLSQADEVDSVMELLPPCNREATKVTEVYFLTDILTEEELSSLRECISSLALKEESKETEQFSIFFKYCLEEVKKSNEDMTNKIAGILFVESLIKFLLIPSRQISAKKIDFCSFSSVIHLKLLNEFCVKTGSTVSRPFSMRDKAMCYVIALTLICCNFRVDLKLLSQVTSVHMNRLSRLARVVGAVPVSKDDTTYQLKLPLPALPKASVPKNKRKLK